MIVLNYHELTEGELGDNWTLSKSRFEADLQLFGKNLITPDAFFGHCKDPHYDHNEGVLLTFDDASLSDYTQIYEIHMAEGNIPGFISFVPTEYVDRPGRMTWRMIREMSLNGVTIGSHGMSHVDLTALSDAELICELVNSRTILEERLGMPITFFAFPFGRFSSRVCNAALTAGYTHLFTIQLGYHRGFESFLYSRLCVSKNMDRNYMESHLSDPNAARSIAWKVSSRLGLYQSIMRRRFRAK